MCSLAMSFPSVYCPLLHLLLPLFALYFAPGRGCFTTATFGLFTALRTAIVAIILSAVSTATMAILVFTGVVETAVGLSTALRTAIMAIIHPAVRTATMLMFIVSGAIRTVV